MNADGYTLAEMLAALAILGLTFGALTEGVRVLAHMQGRAVAAARQAAADRTLQSGLQQTLQGAGPFYSDGRGDLHGAADGFSYPCGQGRCEASLAQDGGRRWLLLTDGRRQRRTPVDASAVFGFVDRDGVTATWPPVGNRPPARLQAIVLRTVDGGAVASARLRTEEPAGCVFDTIAQDCRP